MAMMWGRCSPRCFTPGAPHYKYIDLPLSNYASSNYDRLMVARDWSASRCSPAAATTSAPLLSLATVDPDVKIGNEVKVVWGEEGGGTRKTTVEPHSQIGIRAIVSPVPYSKVAREAYAEGWRTGKV